MKKRILYVLCAMLVFGLATVVFAYNQSVSDDKPAACCCKGDSCPIKRNAAGEFKDVKADTKDCSCCGDSCPMMENHGEGPVASTVHSSDHSKMAGAEHAKADGNAHNSCGDSCRMKKGQKEGETAVYPQTAGSMQQGEMDGETHSCCSCCAEDEIKTAKVAV